MSLLKSTTTSVSLKCDYADCPQVFESPGRASVVLRAEARDLGWGTKNLKAGGRQDFCPEHAGKLRLRRGAPNPFKK